MSVPPTIVAPATSWINSVISASSIATLNVLSKGAIPPAESRVTSNLSSSLWIVTSSTSNV